MVWVVRAQMMIDAEAAARRAAESRSN